MKNKFRALGLVFGTGIGLCVGILIDNIAIGLSLGAGAGLVFGFARLNIIKQENENNNSTR